MHGTELFGAERENIECFKAFRDLGFEVTILSSNRAPGGGEAGELCTDLGFDVRLMPFGSHFSPTYFLRIRGYWHRQIRRVFACSWMIWRILKEESPDFVFIGSTLPFQFIFIPLWIWRDNVIFRIPDAPIRDSWYQSLIFKRLMNACAYGVVCSEFMKRTVQEFHSKSSYKVSVIHNIAPTFHSERPEKSEQGMKLRKHSLLYVGQITPQKGVFELIQAVEALVKEGYDKFELDVVGGSKHTLKYEHELQEYAKSRGVASHIRFHGRVEDPTGFYRKASFHVAPSQYEEPFGLVVVEAKSHGIPSIISPSGGMVELISDGVTGVIALGNSPIDLKEAILRASELEEYFDPTFIKQDYSKNYSRASFVNRWQQLLDLRR